MQQKVRTASVNDALGTKMLSNPLFPSSTGTRNDSKSTKYCGYIIIVIVAVMGIGVVEIAQIATEKFKHALALRYINTAMLTLLFLPCYMWHKHFLCKLNIKYNNNQDCTLYNTNTNTNKPVFPFTFINKKNFFLLILLATLGSLLQNGGGYFFYVAMTGITVPTFGALTALMAPFCFIFSVILLNEKVILWKVIAILLSFIGAIFFVLDLKYNNNNNKSDTHDTWWGILLTIILSVMWPLSDIIFKISQNKCFPNNKIVGTFFYTALMAIIATVVFVFVLFIDPLSKHQWNKILENNATELIWIIICGLYLMSSDALYNIANSMTSPLMLNIGNLMSIPFGFIVDMFVHNYKLTLLPIIGTLFIMIGFLMLEILKPPENYCHIFSKTLYQTNNQNLSLHDKQRIQQKNECVQNPSDEY